MKNRHLLLLPLAAIVNSACSKPNAPESKPQSQVRARDSLDEAIALQMIRKCVGAEIRDPKMSGNPVIQVELNNNLVTDDDVRKLRGLPHLRRLNLAFSQVTDVGIQELSMLTELEYLYLDSTKATGLGLKNFPALIHLDISNATDEGLKEITMLSKLKTLHLHGAFSPAGFKQLASLTQLEMLNASLSQMYEGNPQFLEGRRKEWMKAVKELQQKLPRCTFYVPTS